MALEIAKDGGLARPKILERLLRLRKFSLVLAFVGAYFCAQFLFDPANMEVTRISEHSLMPGLVTPKFDKSGIAGQIFRRISDLPKSKSQQEFIMDVFSEFGLQSFTQKWNSSNAGYSKRGENVYGFVRGHRNDGAEAQLMVVQLGKSKSAKRMISIMLSFIDFAKDQVYWARDLVFVFVDGGEGSESIEQAALALDNFLFKYQKVESLSSKKSLRNKISAEEIQSQTGALIAGVVYDLSGASVKGQHIVKIQTNGLNGQQANLDLFNGIVKIADSKHHSRVSIFGTLHRYASAYMDYFPFTVPIIALITQAFVTTEGIHSVMGKYGVQGVTVGLSHDYSERQCGQFIEEVSRMLNNVLERLHQSYFMYVLGDDMHFLSIGFYLSPTLVLVSPLLLSIYFQWPKLSRDSEFPMGIPGIHLSGYAIYLGINWIFKNIGTEFALCGASFPFLGPDKCDGQFGGPIDTMYLCLIIMMLPLGLYIFKLEPLHTQAVPVMRIWLLLATSIAIMCLSLINFGLGIFTAAVAVPAVFLMTFESEQKARSYFRTAALTILNPITIITVIAWNAPGFATTLIPPKEFNSWTGVPRMFIYNIIKSDNMFDSWLFFILTCVAWPVWTMLFSTSLPYNLDIDRSKEPPTPDDPRPPSSQRFFTTHQPQPQHQNQHQNQYWKKNYQNKRKNK